MSETTAKLRAALADRYTIERELGAGGMATVYLAHDVKHNRKVAVKVLRPDLAATLGPERFVREIEIAANLTHPHILPLYDSGEADGFLFYVMPYVEGESLRNKLDRDGALSVGESVSILREVVDALGYAHERGVVHRDLKPDNVLLSGRHALVADFGVAKAISAATGRDQLTTAGVALGTPGYMSPEQATADPNIDHRSDLYTVGVLAYEILTGEPPFSGSSPQEILAAHVTRQAEPVRKLRDKVPVALDALVLKCLEKRPADRWQSAEELLPHLSLLTTPADGSATTDTRARNGLGSSSRHAISAKQGLIGILTVAFVAVLLWVATRDDSAAVSGAASVAGTAQLPSIAGLPFTDLSSGGDNQYLGDGIAYALMDGLSDAGLTVASAFSFRGREQDVRQIGADLGVTYVMEGSVIMSGQRVRVSVRLVNTSDGFMEWNEDFNDDFGDVLALQDRVVGSVVDQLRNEFGLQEAGPRRTGETENLDAYNAYLQGRFHLERRVTDGIEAALRYFAVALSLDSLYALAWSGLADAQILTIPYQVEGIIPADILEDAIASAERAIAIAPDLAQAYASVGHAYRYQHRWVEAEQASLRAIELDDRYPTAYQWYAVLLLDLGRGDEALAQIETAFQLAPLSLIISAWYAMTPDGLDRLDLSEPRFAALKEKFPREGFSYPWRSYFRRGDFDRAVEEFRQWRDLVVGTAPNTGGDATSLALEPYWPGLLDRSTQQAILRQILNDESVDRGARALAAAHLGDERVFELLGPWPARAIGARHSWIRNDPRYVALFERMGLKP